MTPDQLNERMEDANFDQIERMMRMFDRVLLYNLAVHTMPREFLDHAVQLWDRLVKMGIDRDASLRTDLLESTIAGRRAKLNNAPDGEEVRLDAIKQWGIARDIITSNLMQSSHDQDMD